MSGKRVRLRSAVIVGLVVAALVSIAVTVAWQRRNAAVKPATGWLTSAQQQGRLMPPESESAGPTPTR